MEQPYQTCALGQDCTLLYDFESAITSYLIILTSIIHSSEPPQVHIATTAGVVVAAIVVILLCIGVTIVVCLKIRKQHTRKFDLNRYATVASCSLSLWTTPSELNITESNFSYRISLISSRP